MNRETLKHALIYADFRGHPQKTPPPGRSPGIIAAIIEPAREGKHILHDFPFDPRISVSTALLLY